MAPVGEQAREKESGRWGVVVDTACGGGVLVEYDEGDQEWFNDTDVELFSDLEAIILQLQEL